MSYSPIFKENCTHILCHTYCVIHFFTVSFSVIHQLNSQIFCHTSWWYWRAHNKCSPNSHTILRLLCLSSAGVPKGLEGAAFFKLKPTLRGSMDSFWPQGQRIMDPDSVQTSNVPMSPKVTSHFYPQTPTIWVSMDSFWPQGQRLIVSDSVWTSGPPRTPWDPWRSRE